MSVRQLRKRMTSRSQLSSADTSQILIGYPKLAAYLLHEGFESYYEEFLKHIESYDEHEVSMWTTLQLTNWLGSLSFLESEIERITDTFEKEWIDGDFFINLDEEDWLSMSLSKPSFMLLSCILKGWRHQWDPVTMCESGHIPSVQAGLKADLSALSTEEATQLSAADKDSLVTGRGMFYGQLIVLGHMESKLDNASGLWKAHGPLNEVFTLTRRFIPNGKKPSDGSYLPDPSKDIYQLGRSENNRRNDFIVHGAIHPSNTRQLSSPVSRIACRVECQRSPPFKCYLFASGFISDHEVFVGERFIHVIDEDTGTHDTLTTFGLKLWNPQLQLWYEVSTTGRCYTVRDSTKRGGIHLSAPFTNELVDGSIIDINGVLLVFQSKTRHWRQSACDFIDEMNRRKPVCPVMMHSIAFASLDSHERLLREIDRLHEGGVGYVSPGLIEAPASDYDDIEEGHRAYVFPSCGHVHGFHQSLVGKNCPMCRTPGDFVPLIFHLNSILWRGRPTHVFNPCGHAASRALCEEWSTIPTFVYDTGGDIVDQRYRCPFCCSLLNEMEAGGPYTRLVIQTENGGMIWESSDDEDEDLIDDVASRGVVKFAFKSKARGEVTLQGQLPLPSHFPKHAPQL